jgi:hypothetical protein
MSDDERAFWAPNSNGVGTTRRWKVTSLPSTR